jgi:hypothetical protein
VKDTVKHVRNVLMFIPWQLDLGYWQIIPFWRFWRCCSQLFPKKAAFPMIFLENTADPIFSSHRTIQGACVKKTSSSRRWPSVRRNLGANWIEAGNTAWTIENSIQSKCLVLQSDLFNHQLEVT